MTTTIIITICVLLLMGYIFDITASKTKIPSVVLLLILGWGVRQATTVLGFDIPDLQPALPILGTIGLILIVLEGALELKLDRSKVKLISKSFFLAFVPLVLFSIGLAYMFNYYAHIPLKIGLANAITLSIISSAIAIPSVNNFVDHQREFITYESSFSDIIGFIFFNFIVLNETINMQAFTNFFLNLGIIFLVSILATIALSFLLSKIRHHVKFVPIILLIVLIYSIAKIFHLPSLILILFFGLFLANTAKLKRFELFSRFNIDSLTHEVNRFRELTTEAAFLIRALFFLLFGYLINTAELLNVNTLYWSIGITVALFIVRAIHLLIVRLPLMPLLFIAPRGLITILLFLSIPFEQQISLVNNSLIIQIIVMTSLVMMFGLMRTKKQNKEMPLDFNNKPDKEFED
ncbi:MAG: hypothetical protein PHV20_07920 [Bacteroidales bacterium]|nr:hypothetical protein [Bacteroidales bacterium]